MEEGEHFVSKQIHKKDEISYTNDSFVYERKGKHSNVRTRI